MLTEYNVYNQALKSFVNVGSLQLSGKYTEACYFAPLQAEWVAKAPVPDIPEKPSD